MSDATNGLGVCPSTEACQVCSNTSCKDVLGQETFRLGDCTQALKHTKRNHKDNPLTFTVVNGIERTYGRNGLIGGQDRGPISARTAQNKGRQPERRQPKEPPRK